MKRFCLASLAFLLALAASEARAQTGTARGKVLDEAGKAVEGATITVEFQGGVTRRHETKSNKKGDSHGRPPAGIVQGDRREGRLPG
jgi:hypothetical protein